MKTSTRQNKKRPLHKHVRRYAKLAVVPHKANDYQPHLIRRYGLLAVLLLVVGVQVLYNFGTTGSVLGETAVMSTAALLDGTNDARRAHHLDNLKINEKLNRAAQLKASDMFAKQYWDHNAPDGTKPWQWFAAAGYDYSEAGENLAKNFYTAEATTTAWLNSTEHRENILEPGYTEAGFAAMSGTLYGKPATIVVALYGRPARADIARSSMAVAGAQSQPIGPLTRLGIAVQSVTPAALGSIILLGFVAMIAFVAHLYRDYLPKGSRQARYRHHHGAIKVAGALSLMLVVLILYSGGQV